MEEVEEKSNFVFLVGFKMLKLRSSPMVRRTVLLPSWAPSKRTRGLELSEYTMQASLCSSELRKSKTCSNLNKPVGSLIAVRARKSSS